MKMIKKVFILLTSLIFLISCSSTTQNSSSNQTIATKKIDRSATSETKLPTSDSIIRLDYFSSLPDTIDGCSEAFCYDTSRNIDTNYIFVGNLQNLGMIKVAGKIIFLTEDSATSKRISKTEFKEVFIGDGWTIILTTKTIKQSDEASTEIGTLEIIYNGRRQTIKIKGESGC